MVEEITEETTEVTGDGRGEETDQAEEVIDVSVTMMTAAMTAAVFLVSVQVHPKTGREKIVDPAVHLQILPLLDDENADVSVSPSGTRRRNLRLD